MTPKIFYFAYDHNRPTGGQKQVYRHVDILRKHKITAFVVHATKDFRLTWFPNNTRVIDQQRFLKTIQPEKDFVVLPEDISPQMHLFSDFQTVIFNQNTYLGLLSLVGIPTCPITSINSKAILCVSNHNKELLEYLYPTLPCHLITNGIDTSKFPLPVQKKKQIAFSGTKNRHSIELLQAALHTRAQKGYNRLAGWNWVPIQNMSQEEVASTLQESAIFLQLHIQEGLGLLPMEAIHCGALVVAFRGGPLHEFLDEESSFFADFDDLLTLCKQVEKATCLFEDDFLSFQQKNQDALKRIRTYSLEQEEKSIVDAWNSIFEAKNLD